MTFESEDVRHAFHALPTQKQYEYSHWDLELAETGHFLHIEEVSASEVRVRIDEKLKRSRTD